jgi:DUF971 family protein
VTPAPIKIRLDRPRKILAVEWLDGSCVEFPWAFLRARCPSAGERHERLGGSDPNPLAVLGKVPNAEVADLRLVGNYAVAFTWGDGHGAGIYTWKYLRELAEELAAKAPTP